MAISYPISTALLADKLQISEFVAHQGLQQEWSGTGSGVGYASDVAPAHRQYDVVSSELPNAIAGQCMAVLEALDGSINTMLIYDPRVQYPQYDPTGALVAASTVKINSLNVNNKAMSLKGLPNAYVITMGDFLCWDYGSAPTRRAYQRAAETVTANGSGVTPEFEVRDFILTGSSTDLVVTLRKPTMKCVVVKDSLGDQSAGPLTTRISFSVQQVL